MAFKPICGKIEDKRERELKNSGIFQLMLRTKEDAREWARTCISNSVCDYMREECVEFQHRIYT